MAPGTPDFSAVMTFGETAYGFVAYRHETYLVHGHDGMWLHLPSWGFALGFLGVGFTEYFVLRLALSWIRRRWRKKPGGGPSAA